MLDDIGFWKNIEEVVDNPPMIVVDIFDKDIGVSILHVNLPMIYQVILAGTLTGVQGDIRCKVLAALSTVK